VCLSPDRLAGPASKRHCARPWHHKLRPEAWDGFSHAESERDHQFPCVRQHDSEFNAAKPSRPAPEHRKLRWKGGTGNWSVASDWTPGGVPNNGGGNTYNVTIDGLGGTGQRQYDVHAILRRIGSQTYCQLLHPEILFYKANAAQPLLLGLPPFYESYIYRPSPYLGVASTGSLGTPPCAAWEIQKALTF
jgi:hypothetical protein